jgi:hypothetical protein
MTRPIPESHPLHRLFRGLTETTFMTELGIGDPRLVGYVAGLLARFVPSDSVWRLRDDQGRRLAEVTAMIAEAEAATAADRRRDCHRHVGDFALFWTGVYPEALPRLQAAHRPDHLIDYCARASGRTTWPAPSRTTRPRSCGGSAPSSNSAPSGCPASAASGSATSRKSPPAPSGRSSGPERRRRADPAGPIRRRGRTDRPDAGAPRLEIVAGVC